VVSPEIRAAAEEVLAAYPLDVQSIHAIEVGLINLTLLLEGRGQRWILQRVNPIFGPGVHDDIEAVTAHLAKKGMTTTRLVPTRDARLYTTRGSEVWRVLTFLPGTTKTRLASTQDAEAAGELLGKFHAAVQDLEHQFQNRRLGVHDTPKHLRALRSALEAHRDHPRYGHVGPLGEQILQAADALPALPAVGDRVVHGDPKISNLLFGGDGKATALIDLDTLARMPVNLELGDAFRSWCNPSGEDSTEVRFDLALFEAAVRGYFAGSGPLLRDAERDALVAGTQTIILELASRFAADALVEGYFGWDPKRFATRGEHNELRARGQLALFNSLEAQKDEAERIIRR
jgi:Ser/Thr protein kinase RdoA (MazF antagonist)